MADVSGLPFRYKVYQAIGVFTLSIVTGLVTYKSPPSSFAELGTWIWQPSMQGIMTALGTLGISTGLRRYADNNGVSNGSSRN